MLRHRDRATAAACCCCPPWSLTGTAKPPRNIIVLYADDWRHDTLGVAGHPVVITPRLDQLARDGVRFRRSYVTTSICGVSRASFLTGQWMSRHGNQAFEAFRTPWEETWPGLLRANGYYVGHVGKWHNGPLSGGAVRLWTLLCRTPLHQQQPDGYDASTSRRRTSSTRSNFSGRARPTSRSA
jgi:arylsulfatase A-like enzyme